MVQGVTANVTQDLGELPHHKRCEELAPVCMVKRKFRMGFDQSTSAMWEQGHEEGLWNSSGWWNWFFSLMLTSLTHD